MIITKSISRFARNTLDCLQYIRQLKDKNIPVYFEKESINTLDAKGEVLLTTMASLARQESQSMSENIKLGLQYRYQHGKVQINHNRFLGYTKDENGNLVIDPEQAEIVKRIYREYLEGSSMDKIAAGLMADGILTGAGKEKWHTSTINKILRNEKYMGDALLQKTYTTDFLTKKRIKKANNKQDYDAIADEIFRLRNQKEQSEVDSHLWEETMNRIKELQNFIAEQETDITEFDEALVKKLIEKITVFADHFTVEFKSGITIDIEA